MSVPSDETRAARVEELFHAARAQAAGERAAFVEGVAGGDRSLRDEVLSLLAALDDAPPLLESPAWALGEHWLRSRQPVAHEGPAAAPRASPRIGRYVLRRLLGEGGMGSVYLAEQLEPLRRLVALKIVKLGMDTREVVARFDSERQALAVLGHPHIAAVHDAGVTRRGRPYFVMEYVPGERITTFCDQRRLPIRERLRIFLAVCDAVQHAHTKGIIHRDLKPSNVLVKEEGGRPVPKVIDFGVAKATAATGAVATVTRNGQLVGTPGYMSPEQAGAVDADVDTRTDVYALGVLLYELLTGVLPHEARVLRRASEAEMRRLLAEHEPVRPSLRVDHVSLRARRAAAARGGDVRALRRALRGDLDWIVLRALERDPTRRYASASELAGDLLDHLNGDPVRAGPPSAGYRVRKLAARHRGPVVGSALALLVGVCALLSWAFGASATADGLRTENLAIRGDRDDLAAQVVDLRMAGGAMRPDEASRPYATVLVRNAGPLPLPPGAVVELVGRSHSLAAGQVLDVVLARAGSPRPPLGPIEGRWDPAVAAPRQGPGARPDVSVPPGAVGRVVTHGPFARMSVSAPVDPRDRLTLGPEPGRAVPARGSDPVLGVALDAWEGPGPGTVLAFVAPTFDVPEVPSSRPLARADSNGEPQPPGLTAGFPDGLFPDGRPAEELPSDADPAEEFAPLGPLDGDMGGSALVYPSSAAGSAQGEGSPPTGAAWVDVPRGHGPNQQGAVSDGPGPPPKPLVQQPKGGPKATSPEDPPDVGDEEPAGPVGGLEPVSKGHDGDGGGGGTKPPAAGPILGQAPAAAIPSGPRGDAARGLEAWGDVDGDGLLDLLVLDATGATLLRQTAPGVFRDATGWTGLAAGWAPKSVAWHDFDGDGRADLLSLESDRTLRLRRSAGGGVLDDVTTDAGLADTGAVADLVVLDVDGDDRADLRIVAPEGGQTLLLNDGRGRFSAVVLRPSVEGSEPPTEEDPAASAEPDAPAASR